MVPWWNDDGGLSGWRSTLGLVWQRRLMEESSVGFGCGSTGEVCLHLHVPTISGVFIWSGWRGTGSILNGGLVTVGSELRTGCSSVVG